MSWNVVAFLLQCLAEKLFCPFRLVQLAASLPELDISLRPGGHPQLDSLLQILGGVLGLTGKTKCSPIVECGPRIFGIVFRCLLLRIKLSLFLVFAGYRIL